MTEQVTYPLNVATVSKRFGDGDLAVAAVDGCSVAVKAGETVALSGPSGSGKSTLLGIILGWIAPDGGTVEINVDSAIPVTVVPQDLGLFEELTAAENVAAPGYFQPVGSDTEQTIEQLGLRELLDRLPAELSLGEQQRVAIARAITTEAGVIIADEPTSHQDEENATAVMAALRTAADRGAAVLLTTHDPRIVSACDRLVEICDGRLLDPLASHEPPPSSAPDETPTPPTRSGRSGGRATPRSAGRAYRRVALGAALAILVAALTLAASGSLRDDMEASGSAEVPDAGDRSTADEPVLTDEPGFVEIEVPSPALGATQRALIFLPPGYEADTDGGSDRSYGVLYLLHGQQDRPEQFRRVGLFARAEELMRRSEIEPLIIVAPAIDNSFGVNNPETAVAETPDGNIRYDGGRYEDFLAEDLVDFVDDTYPTIADRSGRFVGGISMGGFAALHLGFNHPELFAKVGGHSPALIGDEFTWLYPNDSTARTRDPLRLATTADLSRTDVFLDAGDGDRYGFAEPTGDLALALADARSVSVSILPGGHDDTYWRRNVDTYLRFYGG